MRALLLHGFAGDPRSWDATIEAGLGAIEPIVPVLPGHGAPLRESWSATIDAFDTRGAPLAIGYSFGARVALGLLARRRVERAILIGVNPGISNEYRGDRRRGDATWARLLRRQGTRDFIEAWEAQPLFATQKSRVAKSDLIARRARRITLDAESLARCLEVMGLAEMPDYRQVLKESGAPLIVGADDAKFLAIARASGNPLTVIPHAGHDVPLENPEALAEAIRRIALAGDPESSPADRS